MGHYHHSSRRRSHSRSRSRSRRHSSSHRDHRSESRSSRSKHESSKEPSVRKQDSEQPQSSVMQPKSVLATMEEGEADFDFKTENTGMDADSSEGSRGLGSSSGMALESSAGVVSESATSLGGSNKRIPAMLRSTPFIASMVKPTTAKVENRSSNGGKLVYVSKKEREEEALKQELKQKQMEQAQFISSIEAQRSTRTLSKEEIRAQQLEMDEYEQRIEHVKQRYLGIRKQRRVIKPSEKFRDQYKADWDDSEDTSRDHNPLYDKPIQPCPLFGLGHIAGIDIQQQRKEADFIPKIIDLRRKELLEMKKAQVAGDTPDDALKRLSELKKRLVTPRDEFAKSTHWKDKKLEEMTDRDWKIVKEDFNIRQRGGKSCNPIRSWNEAQLPPELLHAIAENGWVEPNPIQRIGIPIGMQQKDLIGIAQTGSGKTAAFVIPMLVYIHEKCGETQRSRCAEDGPLAIILAPTRELAQQINDDIEKLGKYLGTRTLCLTGGSSIQAQGFKFNQGVDVIIATPGRLVDAIDSHYIVLTQCRYIVLDEADNMLNLGFEEDLDKIMGTITPEGAKAEDEETAKIQEALAERGECILRTTIMYSATMPPEIEKIAKKYLRRPIYISIGEIDDYNKSITHDIYYMKELQKNGRLMDVVKRSPLPALIFCNTKKGCEGLMRQLEDRGFACCVLHGGRTQEQRESTLHDFKTKGIQIMVATDVAGRGLDIPGIAHVINFDMPKNFEKFVHRVGRTGRAGASGQATSFVTEQDEPIFPDLVEYLARVGYEEKIPREITSAKSVKDSVALAHVVKKSEEVLYK